MKLTALAHGFYVLAGALFLASAGIAQEAKPLSLNEAIQLALKNNRQLQAAAQQREAAAAGVSQARGAFWPRLDIVEGFSYSDRPTTVFSSLLDQASFKERNFAIASLNEPTPLANLNSQIRLEQPIYTGGRLSANLGQAKAAAEASQEITRRTQQEVIFRVIEAYYHALLAEGNLAVVDRALLSARAHLERSSDMFQKGLVVRSDFLRAQVLVGSLERERIEAENLVTIAHSRLRHVLGSEEERFRPTERVSEDSLPLEDLRHQYSEARALRPDLKAAEKEVEKATEGLRVAQADYYPSLGFVTQFDGNTRKFSASGESFAVFVTAKWNLFNGFVTQERVTEAAALLKRAKLLHDDFLQAVGLEVEQAYLGLAASRRQVAVARENVSQAAESLRILKDRYGVGLARNVDVLDGETTLKKAEQDLLQAQVNSQTFRARLNLAVGKLQ
jgi:TolC family type I secretion outer membrane protein